MINHDRQEIASEIDYCIDVVAGIDER